MDDSSNPRDKYLNKVDYHLVHRLKEELDPDEAAFEKLVVEASEWLVDQDMDAYDQMKTKKFKSATNAGKSPTEALVNDLGQKCCRLSDFIEILRNAELESQANLFNAHLQGRCVCVCVCVCVCACACVCKNSNAKMRVKGVCMRKLHLWDQSKWSQL